MAPDINPPNNISVKDALYRPRHNRAFSSPAGPYFVQEHGRVIFRTLRNRGLVCVFIQDEELTKSLLDFRPPLFDPKYTNRP